MAGSSLEEKGRGLHNEGPPIIQFHSLVTITKDILIKSIYNTLTQNRSSIDPYEEWCGYFMLGLCFGAQMASPPYLMNEISAVFLVGSFARMSLMLFDIS